MIAMAPVSLMVICATVAGIATVMIKPVTAAEQKAHQHGQASLHVTVEGQTLRIALDSPLENLVGFERAPRNERERAAVQSMARELRAVEKHFVPSVKAGCRPTGVELESDVLDRGLLSAAGASPEEKSSAKGAAKDASRHADLEASFVFRCERPAELSELQVNLFDTFRRLIRIDVQVAGSKRQAAARLTAGARILKL